MQTIECGRCGRALKNLKARELGYGLICWRKLQGELEKAKREAEDAIIITPTITDGYAGARGPDGSVKVVRIRSGQQTPLKGRWRHTGIASGEFNWGYGGSGPADLARSIIADALGIDDPNPTVYQEFKRSFVASWGDRWEISLEQVRAWLEKRKAAIEA